MWLQAICSDEFQIKKKQKSEFFSSYLRASVQYNSISAHIS